MDVAVRIGQEVGSEVFLAAEQETQHEVGDRIALRLAEQFRGAAGGGDDAPHRHAELVLGVGVAVAVAKAAPIVRLDVGYAVLRAPDGGAEPGLGFGRHFGIRLGR